MPTLDRALAPLSATRWSVISLVSAASDQSCNIELMHSRRSLFGSS
ncbi:unnamed protein product [Calypogeia fissa]